MSEPKPAVFFATPSPMLQPGKFRQRVLKKSVKLSRKTSMLYVIDLPWIQALSLSQPGTQAATCTMHMRPQGRARTSLNDDH